MASPPRSATVPMRTPSGWRMSRRCRPRGHARHDQEVSVGIHWGSLGLQRPMWKNATHEGVLQMRTAGGGDPRVPLSDVDASPVGPDKRKPARRPVSCLDVWSGRRDLNPRPPVPQTGALPDCATPRRWASLAPGAATRRWRPAILRDGRHDPRGDDRCGPRAGPGRAQQVEFEQLTLAGFHAERRGSVATLDLLAEADGVDVGSGSAAWGPIGAESRQRLRLRLGATRAPPPGHRRQPPRPAGRVRPRPGHGEHDDAGLRRRRGRDRVRGAARAGDRRRRAARQARPDRARAGPRRPPDRRGRGRDDGRADGPRARPLRDPPAHPPGDPVPRLGADARRSRRGRRPAPPTRATSRTSACWRSRTDGCSGRSRSSTTATT